MRSMLDGKKIRDEILAEVAAKVEKMDKKPVLAAILVANDSVSEHYVELKRKVCQKVGIDFELFSFEADAAQTEVVEKVKELNEDTCVTGIMVQIPLPAQIDKFDVVNAIAQDKDVDGLRFCGGFKSCFIPPVVSAVLKAVELAGKKIEESETVIVGRGFLVGWPLAQCLEEAVKGLIIVDSNTKRLESITCDADVLISATGSPGLIKPDMIKEGVVLIDAGTSEVGGKQVGDIDPECYEKAAFYTPVPGGIGPLTVAYLMKNLVEK